MKKLKQKAQDESQKGFYEDMIKYFRSELGVKAIISCRNWKTAEPGTLEFLEHYTYTARDIIDRHGYFNSNQEEQQKNVISAEDKYIDRASVKHPGEVPIELVQMDGYPGMSSEIGWTNPNRYKADGVFLVSSYASL